MRIMGTIFCLISGVMWAAGLEPGGTEAGGSTQKGKREQVLGREH